MELDSVINQRESQNATILRELRNHAGAAAKTVCFNTRTGWLYLSNNRHNPSRQFLDPLHASLYAQAEVDGRDF
jgi:hypothetical protein